MKRIDSGKTEDGRADVLNPKGVSFDLNTSYCVYSVIEKKKDSSVLARLPSGLKWINWLNTHGS